MTVGSGSTSQNAAALMATLDRDSGYDSASHTGTSIYDGSPRPAWNPAITEDRPMSAAMGDEESSRRLAESHISQQTFNAKRVALGQQIHRTMGILEGLQVQNATWPAQYPTISSTQPKQTKADSRPIISHTQSTAAFQERPHHTEAPLRPTARRAATSLANEPYVESSTSACKKSPEPESLMSLQAVRQFSVLKCELKVEGLTAAEIAHSQDKKTLASLLDGRINGIKRHLQNLQARINDTSSKVLITGDLNAGKSTFCNALLRRKVLPEDQQPCTSIFCEVLDARENDRLEEVHAVYQDKTYNRQDESTYKPYPLDHLEEVVQDNETYYQCKIYIKDARSVDQSLLNNGAVDISIIDAPGLNADSIQTTAVFARQEEIDVVVFVVDAANRFTLSAKEFIMQAAHEKAYIFMVVNGYDKIKDKRRCEAAILEQVKRLSPDTFKDSSDLVHFVSSNAIPVAPLVSIEGRGGPGGGGDGGGGSSSSLPDQDSNPAEDDGDADPSPKHGSPGEGKGKDKEKIEDFEHLESELRRFVLEKRERSKFAPAKTYLLNINNDLRGLAQHNRALAHSELERVSNELAQLNPEYEESTNACREVTAEVDGEIEQTSSEIYSTTRQSLNSAIAHLANGDLGVEYPGLWNAFQYAEEIKGAMLAQVSAAVGSCEDDARIKTGLGVGFIAQKGLSNLSSAWDAPIFRPEKMFKSKSHALVRQVDTQIEIWDFFDVSGMWERQEKVAGTSMALTVAGVLGSRALGGGSLGWLDGALGAVRIVGTKNVKHLILPGIATASTSLLQPPPSPCHTLLTSFL